MTEGVEQLKSIFTQLEPQIKALGFASDAYGFSPHLTIARVRTGANKQRLTDLVAKRSDFEFGTIKANCLRLKRSQLSLKAQFTRRLENSVPSEKRWPSSKRKRFANKILLKVTPSKTDRQKVDEITRLLEQKVADACKQEGVAAIVRVEGSVAKDTWISENPDIDVFMRLPISIPRKSLGDIGLKIAQRAAEGFETSRAIC